MGEKRIATFELEEVMRNTYGNNYVKEKRWIKKFEFSSCVSCNDWGILWNDDKDAPDMLAMCKTLIDYSKKKLEKERKQREKYAKAKQHPPKREEEE